MRVGFTAPLRSGVWRPGEAGGNVRNLAGMRVRGPVTGVVAVLCAALLVSNRLTDNDYQEMNAPLDSRLVITMPLSGGAPRPSLNLNELSH